MDDDRFAVRLFDFVGDVRRRLHEVEFAILLEPLLRDLPPRCVVDGEIVLPAADDSGLVLIQAVPTVDPSDPALADTAAFCEAYGYSTDISANTIVVGRDSG